MQKSELEKWLWTARTKTIATLNLGLNWWPNTTGKGDMTSPWALAFFAEAAEDRCVGKTLTLATNGAEAGDPRKTIIDKHWIGTGRVHSAHEVLVDFSVHNWDASSPIQLTGESEAWPYWEVGDSLEGNDDYSWDFYKLLVVPSATRLFFARVGGRRGGAAAPERIQGLLRTLQGLIDWYAPALLRPNDELGGVLVPFSGKLVGEAHAFWLDRGRLRWEKMAAPPAVDSTAVDDAGE